MHDPSRTVITDRDGDAEAWQFGRSALVCREAWSASRTSTPIEPTGGVNVAKRNP
jgi:hypothetical protein